MTGRTVNMEGSKEMKCSWGAIVLTCRKRQSAFAFQRGKTILIIQLFCLSNVVYSRENKPRVDAKKIRKAYEMRTASGKPNAYESFWKGFELGIEDVCLAGFI